MSIATNEKAFKYSLQLCTACHALQKHATVILVKLQHEVFVKKIVRRKGN